MNPTINLLKGILILLVIIGHILPGALNENIVRHFIYSFHMPLFIALSGYLINIDKLRALSIGTLLKKYALRALIPWTIAVIAYFIYNNPTISLESLRIKTVIHAFYVPFYHLWYIPAFIGFVFVTYLFVKIKLNHKALLMIGIASFLLFYALLKMPELSNIKNLIKDELHTFRPYYYLFFTLGIFLRNTKGLNLKSAMIASLIGCALTIISYFSSSILLVTVSITAFALGLTLLVIPLMEKNVNIRNRFIEWLGINSLAIYLWHMFPVILVSNFSNERAEVSTVVIQFIATGLLCLVTYILTKVKWVNRICFGNWK